MNIKIGARKPDRLRIFVVFIVVVLLLMIGRLAYLQVYRYDYYKQLSENNRVRVRRIEAPRGKIYDRNGELLVTNVAGYRLVYLNVDSYNRVLMNEKKGRYENLKKDKELLVKEIRDLKSKNKTFPFVHDKSEMISKKESKLERIDESLEEYNEIQKEMQDISELVSMPEEFLRKRLKYAETISFTSEKILIEDLNEELAHKILEKLPRYPYIDVTYYPKRKYLYDSLASHVLGYVKSINEEELENLKDKGYNSRDMIGKKGIEKQYDRVLKGNDGFEYIEVDVHNKIVKNIEVKEPTPGKDIYLTLDFELQKHMTEHLKGKKASFIAVDAKSGEVITMVSSPEYSLNQMASRLSVKEWRKILNDKNRPLQNRATVGSYPPGSIFKPLSAIAFLEDGVDPEDEVYDPGYFKLGKFIWHNWRRGGEGYVNLYKSLEVSCNTYYYSNANKFGYKGIVDVSRRFGLGEDIGIDIPEEKPGILPDPEWKKKNTKETWYKGDSINLSIGQGYLLTTPLQMVNVYEKLANEGKGYQLHFLKKIVDIDGVETETPLVLTEDPQVSTKNYKAVKQGMEDVVSKGTGKAAKVDEFIAAGKTGSAQNNKYDDTHAWFAGYAPADNPEIVFVVFVEGDGGGGSVAAPVAKEFIKKYLEIRKGE